MIDGKLMIGDYVSTTPITEDWDSNEIEPMQITGLPNAKTVIINDWPFSTNSLYPIPLTTSFLHKNTYDEETNTYHVYHSNGYVQYSITNKVYVKYYEGINVFMYEGIKIQYVHQLQHLLSISDYKPLSF